MRLRFLTILGFILGMVYLAGLGLWGCSNSSSQGGGSGGFNNTLYFVSTRFFPNNNELDGDIFSVSLSGGAINNLTDGTTGDDDDYPCISDVLRGRLFFVSERTDIGNTAGDVDIFVVPANGGVITNLTDAAVGDKDDACLGLVAGSGDVVFESSRLTDNPAGDLDIFVATLTTDNSGNVTGATLSNRTEEASGSTVADRLVAIGGSVLYFQSPRTGADDSTAAIDNPQEDMHIFSASITGTRHIVNLTADDDGAGNSGTVAIAGTSVGANAEHMDIFCGLDAAETHLAFMSTRNQGVNGSVTGTQIYPDWDVFVRDLSATPTLVGAAANTAIANLTDAGALTGGTTKPEDNDDFCAFGNGFSAITSATGEDLVLFVSARTGAGEHRSDGDGSAFTTLSEITNLPSQNDTADVFASTVAITPVSGVLNTLTNLTDGTAGDDVDVPVSVCATSLIFESPRTDFAPGSSGVEDDIFAVDLTGTGSIANLTDNATGTGDDNDVFLCCNAANNRVAFASARTDAGNTHGPAGDIDLFSAPLNTAGDIVDMTDAADGDEFDGFASIGPSMKVYTGGSGNPGAAGGTAANAAFLTLNGLGIFPAGGFDIPASSSIPLVTGSPQFTGFSYSQNYFVGGVGYGAVTAFCGGNDQIVWGSHRTQPYNTTGDVDIFVTRFFDSTGAVSTSEDILNLTDASSGSDADDGIVGVNNVVLPDAVF